MAIWCLGIYKKYLASKEILGYLLGDVNSVTEITEKGKKIKKIALKTVSVANVKNGLAANLKIENMELVNGIPKISSGSENSYPCYEPGTDKFLGIGTRGVKACQVYGVVKLPFVVVGRDEKIGMHRCVMASGTIGDYQDAAIIKDVEFGGRVLSNATVVNDNGKKFIRLKKGEPEQIEKVKEIISGMESLSSVKTNTPAPSNASASAQTNVNKAVSQQPRTNNAVVTSLESLFEIRESQEYGPYIARVKPCDKSQIDSIFGVDGMIKPMTIGGKIVRHIDALAMCIEISDKTNRASYVNTVASNENEYLDKIVNRFAFDSTGKNGFICIDAENVFECEVKAEALVVVRNRRRMDYSGTIIIPHKLKTGQVPTGLGGNVSSMDSHICVLSNIKTLYTLTDKNFRGIDLRRSSVTYIPVSFVASSYIRWILLNNRIERIHEKAFMDCVSLKKIRLTSGIKEIAERAFMGCYNLEEVTYEAGTKVRRLSERVFSSCSRLKNIDLRFVEGTLSTGMFRDSGLEGEFIVPGTVVKVGSTNFVGTDIKRLVLQEGVQELGGEILGNKIKSTEEKTFEIIVPKSLVTVGHMKNDSNLSYKVYLEHGCKSEQYWIVEKSRLGERLELIYVGDELGEDEQSFATMLNLMGREGLINSLTAVQGGNDTPFTLQELLNS